MAKTSRSYLSQKDVMASATTLNFFSAANLNADDVNANVRKMVTEIKRQPTTATDCNMNVHPQRELFQHGTGWYWRLLNTFRTTSTTGHTIFRSMNSEVNEASQVLLLCCC